MLRHRLRSNGLSGLAIRGEEVILLSGHLVVLVKNTKSDNGVGVRTASRHRSDGCSCLIGLLMTATLVQQSTE